MGIIIGDYIGTTIGIHSPHSLLSTTREKRLEHGKGIHSAGFPPRSERGSYGRSTFSGFFAGPRLACSVLSQVGDPITLRKGYP